MRLHKPKVEYKLALQENPQGSILTCYYKTNNLTRINWLNTRLIIDSNKIRHEVPCKTKRVKYTEIWKKSIKIVKESKPSFFLHCAQCFTYPSLFKFLLFSLHHHRHISIVSPPPPPPPHFYCFSSSSSSSPSSFLLFSLERPKRPKSGLKGLEGQTWRENNRNEEEVEEKEEEEEEREGKQ